MERFIKNDLLKRVSAQDWVNPKDMLPWSAQNGHKFIVLLRQVGYKLRNTVQNK